MRPVSPRFLTEIKQSHRVVVRAEILDQDGVSVLVTDKVVDGNVTLDSGAAVRGRLDVTLVDDGHLGLVPKLASDPLAPYGNEIKVYRGVQYSDGTEEVVSLGVFRIDDVTVADGDQGLTIQIAAQDRASRIADARFEAPYQVPTATEYSVAIQAVVEEGVVGLTFDLTAAGQDAPQTVAEEGADRLAFVKEMAKSSGMDLYLNGDGVVVTRPVALSTTEAVWSLVEGDQGLLVAASKSWTRQGAFNRVIATGENTGETAPARGIATDNNPDSPTYYYGPFGHVPRFYASPFITTDDQAVSAAEAILAKELGTSQAIDFGAIVNPALEPNDVIEIKRARAGISSSYILDSVTIPLSAAGVMSGKTRSVFFTPTA